MVDPQPVQFRWWPVLAAWAIVALLLGARAVLQFGAVPLLGDSDDAMRIVTATELLGGQAWQDIVVHRDNAPFGAELHWSPLVDAPLALLIAIMRPFAGAYAPDVAAIVWPLLLLFPLLALSLGAVRRLVPEADTVTALAVPLISLVLLIEFLPGRVDHHNVQILLMLAAMVTMLRARTTAAGGAVLGVLLATSLAVGLETLPLIVLAILLMALFWVRDPERYWASTVALGLSFGAGTLVHFLIAVAPARYAQVACDMLSIAHVAVAVFGGLGLAAIAALGASVPHRMLRLALVALAAIAVVAGVALVFPACLASPYAMVDPQVAATLFAGIAEVQPVWRRLAEDPATGIAFTLPALVGLGAAVIRLFSRTDGRGDWVIATAFLAVSVLVMLVQIRGARFAGAFAIPPAVWLISFVRARYVARATLDRTVGLVGSWLLFAGVLQYAAIATVAPRAATAAPSPFSSVACFTAGDYAALAALPPGIVVAPVRIGAHILRYTPHAVVSAGFHRNNEGTLDVLAFFGPDAEGALAIAETRGITYVADCNDANAVLLTEREWLTALPRRGALSLYTVDIGGGG